MERNQCPHWWFHKPQRQFLLTLTTTLLVFSGRANFTNLRRYSDWSEKTYRRHYRFEDGTEVYLAWVYPPTFKRAIQVV